MQQLIKESALGTGFASPSSLILGAEGGVMDFIHLPPPQTKPNGKIAGGELERGNWQ